MHLLRPWVCYTLNPLLFTGKDLRVRYSIGPRNRAPLGMKTTNARANFPTPAPGPQSTKLGSETMKASASRRPKPRAFHAETTKLGVLDDQDELEEPEIEYMPPRPKGTIFPYIADPILNVLRSSRPSRRSSGTRPLSSPPRKPDPWLPRLLCQQTRA